MVTMSISICIPMLVSVVYLGLSKWYVIFGRRYLLLWKRKFNQRFNNINNIIQSNGKKCVIGTYIHKTYIIVLYLQNQITLKVHGGNSLLLKSFAWFIDSWLLTLMMSTDQENSVRRSFEDISFIWKKNLYVTFI